MGVFMQLPAPRGLQGLVEEGVCSWLQDGPGVSQDRGLELTGAKESSMSLSMPALTGLIITRVLCMPGLKYIKIQGDGFVPSC